MINDKNINANINFFIFKIKYILNSQKSVIIKGVTVKKLFTPINIQKLFFVFPFIKHILFFRAIKNL